MSAASERIRIQRGAPDPEQLAAVTVVLLARLTGGGGLPPGAGPCPGRAQWRRADRGAGYRAPRSWSAAPRATGLPRY